MMSAAPNMMSLADGSPAARGAALSRSDRPSASRSASHSPRSSFRSACVWALALAAPIEIVLFGMFFYPVDAGFEPDASLYGRVLSTLSLIIHWPGLVVFDWLVRHHGNAAAEMLAVAGAGYFDLSLLLLGVILPAARLFRRLRSSTAA